MVLRIIKEGYPLDEVVYFDIGVDFDSIYQNVERIKPILALYGAELTILKPRDTFLYTMLEKPVKKRNGTLQCGYKWCGGNCRWGTNLKLEAIAKHNKKYGDEAIVEYVGIASDERERMNRERNGNRVKIYPLVEWGMTEADCLQYCYSHGWHWNEKGYELYDLLDRVSCKYCRNKNLQELRNIYHYLPELWKELKDLQDNVQMPYKDGKTIHDLEMRFITEDAQMTLFDYAGGNLN